MKFVMRVIIKGWAVKLPKGLRFFETRREARAAAKKQGGQVLHIAICEIPQ